MLAQPLLAAIHSCAELPNSGFCSYPIGQSGTPTTPVITIAHQHSAGVRLHPRPTLPPPPAITLSTLLVSCNAQPCWCVASARCATAAPALQPHNWLVTQLQLLWLWLFHGTSAWNYGAAEAMCVWLKQSSCRFPCCLPLSEPATHPSTDRPA